MRKANKQYELLSYIHADILSVSISILNGLTNKMATKYQHLGMNKEIALLQALEMYQGRGLKEDQALALWKQCILEPELFGLLYLHSLLKKYFE